MPLSACAYRTLRGFPQAKVDSEINAPFLLNEDVTYIFLFSNNSVYVKVLSEEKKDIAQSVHKNVTLECKL